MKRLPLLVLTFALGLSAVAQATDFDRGFGNNGLIRDQFRTEPEGSPVLPSPPRYPWTGHNPLSGDEDGAVVLRIDRGGVAEASRRQVDHGHPVVVESGVERPGGRVAGDDQIAEEADLLRRRLTQDGDGPVQRESFLAARFKRNGRDRTYSRNGRAVEGARQAGGHDHSVTAMDVDDVGRAVLPGNDLSISDEGEWKYVAYTAARFRAW